MCFRVTYGKAQKRRQDKSMSYTETQTRKNCAQCFPMFQIAIRRFHPIANFSTVKLLSYCCSSHQQFWNESTFWILPNLYLHLFLMKQLKYVLYTNLYRNQNPDLCDTSELKAFLNIKCQKDDTTIKGFHTVNLAINTIFGRIKTPTQERKEEYSKTMNLDNHLTN